MAVNAKHGVSDLLHFGELAEVDVFLDLDEHVLEHIVNLLAIDHGILEVVDRGDSLSFDSLHGHVGESDEVVVVGNRFRFAREFESGGLVSGFDEVDAAFLGGLVGALGGNSSTLLAEEFNGLVHVAVSFGEGLLALHHAHASLLAEFVNEGSGNLHITFLPRRCRTSSLLPCRPSCRRNALQRWRQCSR